MSTADRDDRPPLDFGILLNLAFGAKMATAENWFILTPDSPFKYLSVYMMILHNVQAWVLWVSVVAD